MVVAALYREVRAGECYRTAIPGTVRYPERRPIDVVVEDLSWSGFRVVLGGGLEAGDIVSLGLPGVGPCPAVVVRPTRDGYGCRFLAPLSAAELHAALTAEPAAPIPFPRDPA